VGLLALSMPWHAAIAQAEPLSPTAESEPPPAVPLPSELPAPAELPPTAPRSTGSGTPEARALDGFVNEAVECVAVFHIGAHVGQRAGDEPTFEMGTKASRFALRIAMIFAQSDVSGDLTRQFVEQARVMNGRDANWPALWERHQTACKQLVETPRARLLHWLARTS
jgi:hypothetical protein